MTEKRYDTIWDFCDWLSYQGIAYETLYYGSNKDIDNLIKKYLNDEEWFNKKVILMNDDINRMNQSNVLLEKELQHLANETHKFNVSLAKLFLGLPIPMSYELWCYLHSIVEGDSE